MALFGLTMALAKELGEDNIRVNCIAPGLIKTQFGECVSVMNYDFDEDIKVNTYYNHFSLTLDIKK